MTCPGRIELENRPARRCVLPRENGLKWKIYPPEVRFDLSRAYRDWITDPNRICDPDLTSGFFVRVTGIEMFNYKN